jgi:hypothetical protein
MLESRPFSLSAIKLFTICIFKTWIHLYFWVAAYYCIFLFMWLISDTSCFLRNTKTLNMCAWSGVNNFHYKAIFRSFPLRKNIHSPLSRDQHSFLHSFVHLQYSLLGSSSLSNRLFEVRPCPLPRTLLLPIWLGDQALHFLSSPLSFLVIIYS